MNKIEFQQQIDHDLSVYEDETNRFIYHYKNGIVQVREPHKSNHIEEFLNYKLDNVIEDLRKYLTMEITEVNYKTALNCYKNEFVRFLSIVNGIKIVKFEDGDELNLERIAFIKELEQSIDFINEEIKELEKGKFKLIPKKIEQNFNITPKQNQQLTNGIIINWNGNKSALADIFKQLKNITNNKTGEPLIGNSYEDIALFLRNNFDVYQNTELSTIQTTLKQNTTIPKSTNRIIVDTKE